MEHPWKPPLLLRTPGKKFGAARVLREIYTMEPGARPGRENNTNNTNNKEP